MRSPVALALVALALVLSACSTGATPTPSAPAGGSASPSAAGSTGAFSVLPVIVSTEQVVGPNRLLFSFVDASTNAPASAPDRTASITVFPAAKGSSAAVSSPGTFLWTIPDDRGIYRADVDFTEPGEWIASFQTAPAGGPSESIGPFKFDVQADGSAVVLGENAPSVDTPTLSDVGGEIARLSTDDAPDPAFYEISEADALAAGKPFVLVFATPAFCTSQACGPLLDDVKALAPDFPGVTFINVEPYKLTYADGNLQPERDSDGHLQPTESTTAFGILSEPWVYVVGADGTVTGSFEAAADATELRRAIEGIAPCVSPRSYAASSR